MVSMSEMDGPIIATRYDWSRFKKVLDLGGGHGGLVKHLQPKNPKAEWAIGELQSVCAVAQEKAPKEVRMDSDEHISPTSLRSCSTLGSSGLQLISS